MRLLLLLAFLLALASCTHKCREDAYIERWLLSENKYDQLLGDTARMKQIIEEMRQDSMHITFGGLRFKVPKYNSQLRMNDDSIIITFK
jgi:exopolyphosphatase/pppGpp-phosphohydrolase